MNDFPADTVLSVHELTDIIPVHTKPDAVGPIRPAALWSVLESDPGRIFACLDAAKIPNLVERLEAEDIDHACLFDGEAAEEYAGVAPWIAEIPVGSGFLDHLFSGEPEITGLWPFDGGILFQSSASMDALRNHFRRLTKIPRVDGREVFFRFWDPLVASGYFAAVADWPDRVASLLVSRHARVERLIVPVWATRSATLFDLNGQVTTPPAASALRLEARDLKILADLQWPRLNSELCEWTRRADRARFRGFDDARLSILAAHAIREGRAFGLTYKEEFAYLLYMMTFLGGWFHKGPQFAYFAELLAHKSDERIAVLTREFPDRYARVFGHLGEPGPQMETLRKAVAAILEQAGGWAQIESRHAEALAEEIARRLLWHEDQVRMVQADARAAAHDAGITDPRDVAVHHVMWLILGPHFLADPLYPWAGEKFADAPAKRHAILHVAAYGFRRLTRTLSLQKALGHA